MHYWDCWGRYCYVIILICAAVYVQEKPSLQRRMVARRGFVSQDLAKRQTPTLCSTAQYLMSHLTLEQPNTTLFTNHDTHVTLVL